MRIFIVVLSLLACLMPWRMALAGDGLTCPASLSNLDTMALR